MSNERRAATNGGIGFFGLLTILFIALKLTNYITWPWWLVLAPLWGPLGLLVFLLLTFVPAWHLGESLRDWIAHRRAARKRVNNFHQAADAWKRVDDRRKEKLD